MSEEPTTPGADPSDKPERVTERWTCGGVRVGAKGKKLIAWFDPDGKELYFAADRGSGPIPGADYEVTVTRDGDGITLHGSPRFLEVCADTERRAVIMATDKGWRAQIESERRLKAAKADDPFMEACDRVAAVLAKVPAPQRQMAIYAAMERITRKSWR